MSGFSYRERYFGKSLKVLNITSGIFKHSFSSIGKINTYAQIINSWEFSVQVQSARLNKNLKIGDKVYVMHKGSCPSPIVDIPRGGIRIRKANQIAASMNNSALEIYGISPGTSKHSDNVEKSSEKTGTKVVLQNDSTENTENSNVSSSSQVDPQTEESDIDVDSQPSKRRKIEM